MNKNELGINLFVCGMFLVHGLISRPFSSDKEKDSVDLVNRLLLLGMLFWLIAMANSSTALVTLILGSGMLVIAHLSAGTRRLVYVGGVGVLLLGILGNAFGFGEGGYSLVGRDQSLTGRTDLWADLLGVQINPILGTGFRSFWLGSRAEYFWDKYYFHPVQAHNGYLETYLNVGIIGVCLLIGLIVSSGLRLGKEMFVGGSIRILQLTLLIVAVVYNWTEALFNSSTLLWFTLLISVMKVQNVAANGLHPVGSER